MPAYSITDVYDVIMADSHHSENLPGVFISEKDTDKEVINKLKQVGILKENPEDNACWIARRGEGRLLVIGPAGPVDEARGEVVYYQLDKR